MWADNNGTSFEPGANVGEFLIFCATIPSPSSIALAGLGLVLAGRRSRK
jgi:MYXO-CTERM domain-containing protein